MNALRALVLLVCFTVPAWSAELSEQLPATLVVDGVTYSNVIWRTATPSTVTIFHQTGVARISLQSLSPELQKHFGYDPAKAAAYDAAQKTAETARQQALQSRPADEEGSGSLGDADFSRPFVARTTAGASVRFPRDYKGKIVLLDFWASWCRPCRREIPFVVEAYRKHHADGFEVLGISLDRPQDKVRMLEFIHEQKMPWPQIYDGGFWKAELAVKYDVHSIPRPILVDGDTGAILAQASAARGRALDRAIKRALAAKTRKSTDS